MEEIYAVYDDKSGQFLEVGYRGGMRFPHWSIEPGRWSLSKAIAIVKNRKHLNWATRPPWLDGNPPRLALRIVRVRSKEFEKLLRHSIDAKVEYGYKPYDHRYMLSNISAKK